MSTTRSQEYTCAWCDEPRQHSVKGSFCSIECWYKHKGDKALNLLRYDHRLCTCGRWLKEVEEPPEHILESLTPESGKALVGFQYTTPNAEHVEKEFAIDDYNSLIRTGIGCECGVTDTTELDDDLIDIELAVVLANYVKRFRELYSEGQLDQQIDKDVFFETYQEERDLIYALGRSLYQ